MEYATLSRRAALQWVVVSTGGSLLTSFPLLAAALPPGKARPARVAPVVSFHLDRPYLDPTGTAKPYVPGGGAAAATPNVAIREELWRYRAVFV